MSFPLKIYFAALACAFAASYLALPAWRAWCRRIGLVDDPGHRKIHQTPIPLAGGFAVLTGLIAPIALGAAGLAWRQGAIPAGNLLGHGFERRTAELAAIVAGALGMTLLGWLDDKRELSPLPKFAGQLFIALIVAAAGVRITLFVPSVTFSYAITVLWILTLINALNFMDNMNGLCAGLGAIGSGCFAVIAAMNGDYLVALAALVTTGALLGFLPHNFPEASAFLGDAGSHLVGYLLAVMAILPHFYSTKHPRTWAVFTPLLVLAVPLGDLAWVVLWRLRHGKPFYVGDTNHLSHRLVRRGLGRRGAVMLIWLLAAVSGALGVWLNL